MRAAESALRAAQRFRLRCGRASQSRAVAAAAQAAAQAAAHRARRGGAQFARAAAASAAFPPPPPRVPTAPRCDGRGGAAAPRRAAAFCAAAAAPPDGEVQVQTPLCERPAEHEVTGEALWRFRAAAQAQIDALGPAALEADGVGASGAELRQELTWLLDDAVGGARDAASAWRPAAWAAVSRSGAPPALLRLRAPLPALEELWRRRLAREPFQYLVAAAHWRDLLLAVGPGVLIPRPETETLIDLAAAAIQHAPALAHGAWADVGTGSGAIAVALARLLAADAPPVAATDVSGAALAYAAANAARAGVAGRVAPARGEWLAPVLAARGPACLSGVVSNPPYIPSARLPGLQPEVRGFEPSLALDGGDGDGAAALRRVAADAAAALRPGGFMALETDGWGQGDLIAAELEAMRAPGGGGGGAFERVEVVPDLAGVRRFVTAWRAG